MNKNIREVDDKCYLLCKMQSRIFARASKEKIPSSYFCKVFFNSKYCKMFDDLSILDTNLYDDFIFEEIRKDVHMDRGTVLPDYVMSWIGYLMREWAYVYKLRSKQISKNVPISYLANVYNPYHMFDILKAIQLIVEDRELDINEDINERLYKILKETIVLPF